MTARDKDYEHGQSEANTHISVAMKKKTPLEKEAIVQQRREKIIEYRRKVAKEERQRRYVLRYGVPDEKEAMTKSLESSQNESPKKKKKKSKFRGERIGSFTTRSTIDSATQ